MFTDPKYRRRGIAKMIIVLLIEKGRKEKG